ncbi:MAG: hypothetical protein ACOYXT_19745 [Bacteroidota bacterium]
MSNRDPKPTRLIGSIAALVGLAGSLGFLLLEGRHTPLLLLILFIGWVSSPFLAMLLAAWFFRRRSALGNPALHWLMLIVAIGSLAMYSKVFQLNFRPAAIFLITPGVSWLLLIIVVLVTKAFSSKET